MSTSEGLSTIDDNFHETWVEKCTHSASWIWFRTCSLVAELPTKTGVCNNSATIVASCSAWGMSFQPQWAVIELGSFGFPTIRLLTFEIKKSIQTS